MTRLLPLLVLLAACGGPSEEPVDTDTDTDVEETDTETPVEETDTEEPVDETDTDPDGIPEVTILDLRSSTGKAAVGDVVRIRDAVVVTVSTHDFMRGFTVQTATPAERTGLWVSLPQGDLPTVGDTVDLVGRYLEVGPPGAFPPTQTRTVLEIADDVADAGWTLTGTGTMVPPVELPIEQFLQKLEAHESMLVRLTGTLTVTSGPGQDGDFEVAPPITGAAGVKVANLFVNPSAGLDDFGPNATFTSITGVNFYHEGYLFLPRSADDLVGYQPPPPEDTDDTDIEPDDTFETGAFDPGITPATTTNLHLGLYLPGYLLEFEDMVVTAVRYRTTPAASNGFVVQTPGLSQNAGLYVFVANTTNLPAVGDIVKLVGRYERVPSIPGELPPYTQSLARVYVHESIPDTYFQVTGHTNTLPTPVELTIDDLQDVAAIEKYESMLVKLDPPEPLVITSGVTDSFEVSTISSGTASAVIRSQFHDLRTTLPGLSTSDEFDAIRGVLWFEGSSFRIAPTSKSDAIGYVDR